MKVSAAFASCLLIGLVASIVTGSEPDGKLTSLFDGKSLDGWKPIEKEKSEFENHGQVLVKDGCLIIEAGKPATGVRWNGTGIPQIDYELTLEAKRVEGDDFFCGLTFPVDDSELTLILGGWGGWVVGLSCINGYYAIENETCQKVEFEQNHWYCVRLRVTEPKIEVWLDDKKIVALSTEEREFAVSEEMEPCRRLGLATWRTTGAVRKIGLRRLD